MLRGLALAGASARRSEGRAATTTGGERGDAENGETYDGACRQSTLTLHGIFSGGLLPELLGETDEDSFGTPDVAEPVDVLVIDNFIDQRRTELAEPGEGVIDVLNGEHYALVSQRVHGSCAVIGLD